MQALLITLAVLAVLALLLLSSAVLTVRLDENFTLYIRYLFIRIRLYPQKEQRAKKKDAGGQTKKEKADKPKKPNPFQRLVEEKGFLEAVGQLCEIAKEAMARLSQLLRHVRICPFRLEITAGGEDAAETALIYGGICAAVYPVLGTLCSLSHVRRFETDIHPDFDGGKSYARLLAKCRLRPVFVILFIIELAFDIYKWKVGKPASATVKEGVQK